MKPTLFKNITVVSFVILVVFGMGCEDSITEPPVDMVYEATIRGVVTLPDMRPVAGATVMASSTTQGTFTSTTDDQGRYELTLTVSPDQPTTNFSITVSKPGLGSVMQALNIARNNVIDLNFVLGTAVIDGTSEEASNIVIVDVSEKAIGIRGSGFNETSVILFEVRDANGNPVDSLHTVEVTFSILGGPNGGEFVHPQSAFTDGNGRVRATINSGSQPGVVQLLAEATVNETEIKSSPVLITIHGGLPNQDHFTVSSRAVNIAGYDVSGVPVEIIVQVGDKNGNPVPPETPVWFTTTGGIIQGSTTTDADGFGSAMLYTGNPKPNHPVLGPGFATVRASTRGDQGSLIHDSTLVLFSGRTVISGVSNFFTIDPGDTKAFEFFVGDANGNPLVEGSQIRVSVEGEGSADVELRGDIDVTLPDTQDRERWTQFAFTVRDENPDEERNKVLEILIEVTSPNGNEKKSVAGVLLGSADVPPSEGDDMFRKPHNIVLLNVEHQSVSVVGTGAIVSSRVTFRVVDLLNRPITAANQVNVAFTLTGPGGGESLNIVSALTDEQGRVTTVLTSGTRAGVAQIGASMTVDDVTISAQPVKIVIHAGLPVQENFYIYRIDQRNYPIMQDGMNVRIQAGDRYNNPAQPGTAVYFTTTAGIVQAEAWTDQNGFANATFWGRREISDPVHGNGFGYITASTRDENNQLISDSVLILVSQEPIITSDSNNIAVVQGGTTTVNFTVADVNGNPMAKGQRIVVSLLLPPVGIGQDPYNILLMGDTDITLPDTQNSAATQYSFTVGTDDLRTFNFAVRIYTEGPNGTAVKTLSGRANP